jgi:hypothetical protein
MCGGCCSEHAHIIPSLRSQLCALLLKNGCFWLLPLTPESTLLYLQSVSQCAV